MDNTQIEALFEKFKKECPQCWSTDGPNPTWQSILSNCIQQKEEEKVANSNIEFYKKGLVSGFSTTDPLINRFIKSIDDIKEAGLWPQFKNQNKELLIKLEYILRGAIEPPKQ